MGVELCSGSRAYLQDQGTEELRLKSSPKVGNPIASILKGIVEGIPALFVLNPVSKFLGFTI